MPGHFGSWFLKLRKARGANYLNFLLRLLQFIDAIAIIGFYAPDLAKAHKADVYTDSKWVYAVSVGAIAAFTALVFNIASMLCQYRTVALFFVWDWIVTIFFGVLSGIFGSMYFHEKVEYEASIQRMKIAAGFDLAGLILYCISALLGTYFFLTDMRGMGHLKRGDDEITHEYTKHWYDKASRERKDRRQRK